MKYASLIVICLLCGSAELKKDENLTIKSGNVSITVDPQVSGRIVTFALNGKNVLTDQEVHSFNYGSTLWPAPQSEWHWPPYEALDKDPYQIEKYNTREILLKSRPDTVSGLQFIKHFITKKKYISIIYGIKNISSQIRKVAAWEVTRVDTSGRAFFPLSGEPPMDKSSLQNIKITDNYLWYIPDFEKLENSQKYYGYGKKGYLGWVTDNILFVKSFPDIRPEQPAPGQAEIEIFAHSQYPYIELENHGPYVNLQPDEALNYEVKWYLKKLKDNLTDQEIIEQAEGLVGY